MHFALVPGKTSLTFSMVHLLHRLGLYGVDGPVFYILTYNCIIRSTGGFRPRGFVLPFN